MRGSIELTYFANRRTTPKSRGAALRLDIRRCDCPLQRQLRRDKPRSFSFRESQEVVKQVGLALQFETKLSTKLQVIVEMDALNCSLRSSRPRLRESAERVQIDLRVNLGGLSMLVPEHIADASE